MRRRQPKIERKDSNKKKFNTTEENTKEEKGEGKTRGSKHRETEHNATKVAEESKREVMERVVRLYCEALASTYNPPVSLPSPIIGVYSLMSSLRLVS